MARIILFVRNDSGASAVEYGLIAAAAALAISAIVPILKNA